MKVFCVGLNHRTAPIEARERFAGNAGSVAALREAGCAESLLLTTCNRVEVYGASNRELELNELANALETTGEPVREGDLAAFYRHGHDGCAQHLFRVVSGLDSMVIGETEILGQTKRAYELAQAKGDAGACLHRLFQRAFRVAKQVRTKTQITRGSVSVGSVAVELAEKIFGDLRGRKVLVLGAGETSEKTLRALASRGVSDLRVSNRTPARAEELAAELDGMAVPFSGWLEQCREIDILISSTAADSYLLARKNLAPLIRERIDRPLFVIDIAVPRNIAPEINELDGVYLYDIDSLQSIANETLELRRQQFVAAEAIIDEHVTDFIGGIGRNRCDDGRAERSEAKLAPTLRPSEL
jgi:glutamyl-tRNA reductase